MLLGPSDRNLLMAVCSKTCIISMFKSVHYCQTNFASAKTTHINNEVKFGGLKERELQNWKTTVLTKELSVNKFLNLKLWVQISIMWRFFVEKASKVLELPRYWLWIKVNIIGCLNTKCRNHCTHLKQVPQHGLAILHFSRKSL